MSKIFSAWPEGYPRTLDYPELPVFEILNQTARRVPHRTALIFDRLELTFADLHNLSNRFAAALAALGVVKGERVAVHLPNSPQFAITYYGLLRAGAVFTPVSPLLAPDEVSLQLQDSGAKVLVTLEQLYASIKEILGDTQVREVITTSLADCQPDLLSSLEKADRSSRGETRDLIDLLNRHSPDPPQIAIDPKQDLAHLAYTGGTTGRSKGVMLTHFNVLANVIQTACWFAGADLHVRNGQMRIAYPEGIDTVRDRAIHPGEEVSLVVNPWFHAMGVVGSLNTPIFLGNTMVVLPKFQPESYLDAIDRYPVTIISGAPTLYAQLLNHPQSQGRFNRIKLAISGAAPLPVSLLDQILASMPGAACESYGLTECTMFVSSNPPVRGRHKPGSVGLPTFDTEVKICDPKSGRTVMVGQEGEICIKGPQVMQGYWNHPDETAQVLKGGWVQTGDIGKLDKDGFLFITDRKKDMIIYKGYNVYPRELEEVISRHPSVALCAVVGKPDEKTGEKPIAFIQPKPETPVVPEELMEFVNTRVAHYRKLHEVVIVDKLPVLGPGKVLKRVLKEKFSLLKREPQS